MTQSLIKASTKEEKVGGGEVTNKSLLKVSTLGEKWGKSHEDVITQGMHTGEKVAKSH